MREMCSSKLNLLPLAYGENIRGNVAFVSDQASLIQLDTAYFES
jgi:hypothetical protein